MKNNYSIKIVIPVHNRIEYTKKCLCSLFRQTIKSFEIIIIDDGSTDGTINVLHSDFPNVKVILGDGNLWWTAATNLGVKYALEQAADFILTLNNDTVAPPDFLEKMIFWAERTPQALLGALAIDAHTGKMVYGGERIDWSKAKYNHLLDTLPESERHGLHEVTHFPGRGLLIPSDVFRKIGLFDQRHFPHYAADFDFTHRAVRAGYKIFCNYDARLFTYPEASGGVQLRRNKTIGNYYQHLFGIKGVANLKVFVFYACLNCPKKYLPFFLFQGLLRRMVGYWLH